MLAGVKGGKAVPGLHLRPRGHEGDHDPRRHRRHLDGIPQRDPPARVAQRAGREDAHPRVPAARGRARHPDARGRSARRPIHPLLPDPRRMTPTDSDPAAIRRRESPYAEALGIEVEALDAERRRAAPAVPRGERQPRRRAARRSGGVARRHRRQAVTRAALGDESGPWHTTGLHVSYLAAAINEAVARRDATAAPRQGALLPRRRGRDRRRQGDRARLGRGARATGQGGGGHTRQRRRQRRDGAGADGRARGQPRLHRRARHPRRADAAAGARGCACRGARPTAAGSAAAARGHARRRGAGAARHRRRDGRLVGHRAWPVQGVDAGDPGPGAGAAAGRRSGRLWPRVERDDEMFWSEVEVAEVESLRVCARGVVLYRIVV